MDNLNMRVINDYTVQLVADHMWAVDEFGADMCYVVEGNDRALVVDTGYGYGNLRDTVEQITSLPYVVVNTHGHMDHVCGNWQFDVDTYMHEADLFLIEPEYLRGRWLSSCEKTKKEPGFTGGLHVNGDKVPVIQKPLPLKEHQIFDLGGRTLEVLFTPGHTPGCIVLLDKKNRLLVAGDTVVSTPILIFDTYSATVEEYRDSLLKMLEREQDFDLIVSGHYLRPIGKQYLYDLIDCAEQILKGTAEREPVDFSHMSEEPAVISRYGKASIAYSGKHINKSAAKNEAER